MPLKEICIQNSTQSKKNLGYCECHAIQFAIQTRVSFRVTQGYQGCLGHCLVKCNKSLGLQRLHSGPCFQDVTHSLRLLFSHFPHVWMESPLLHLVTVISGPIRVHLCLSFLHGPLLIFNLVSESTLHSEERSGEVSVAEEQLQCHL